ncbi:MAG: hypothetical protein O7C68_01250 [Rickettsia endosymbiont of Ixodes ricinus]|nr:hypothetical protein [Rickettsia helvetica]MCZ6884418.1 hypothetical protein [Rickettsia endosymbiont of Ixodes ricinus]MCZ6896298.1 hypothetical protein [Rickettsia endosymbiont of Ixodes ricinus]
MTHKLPLEVNFARSPLLS